MSYARRILIGWLLLASATASASRLATVDSDTVEVREGPGKKYKVIEKLKKGTALAASNLPVEGFYKVRTPQGTVGFIAADALVLSPPPSEETPLPLSSEPPISSSAGPAGPDTRTSASGESGFRERSQKKHLRLKALGGYGFFSVGDVNNLFSANVLQFGFNAGGEFEYLFTPDLAMVIRMERVFKTVFARDLKTLDTIQMDLSSIPFMTGIELTLTQDIKFATHFSILVGLALQTELKSTDQSAVAPNITDMSTYAFTGLAKLDGTYSFNKTWSVFAEAGYRYLKTQAITPTDNQNGSAIFKDPNTQQYIPISLDLSGPFVGGGVAFTF